MPGKAWLDNMADSIYNSRKVILVMSMNYLSSAFCKDEMRMAIHRCSERDDSSLIVVRIDNIRSSDIPRSLRHRTFIDVTSKEETTTWQRRILEYVQSASSFGSVTSDGSFNDTDTRSLLSMFKLMRKKKRNNAERELDNQANAWWWLRLTIFSLLRKVAKTANETVATTYYLHSEWSDV